VKFFEQVYAVVGCIPPGRVATYGQIARLLGQPHAARTVGWAMRGAPEDRDIPWHRVVNAAGRISLPSPDGIAEQRRLLLSEGVVFGRDERIDLTRFGWDGLPEHEMRKMLTQVESNDEPSLC
jgi:methylated-DNA-protein-cysteine methyltransferase-like protein